MLQGQAMSQRQGATTQGVSLKVAWHGIAWKQVQRQVFRLHKRLDRAAQREEVSTVHQRQKLLVKSW
jgi:RNA-directed DNA polymerase